ncbi:MAG: hypothetical protein ABI175_01975 [Polyangiales bacterium]
MPTWLCLAIALVGCGRHNFDELSDAEPGGDSPDGASACSTTFCDDFDRPPPATDGWDGMRSGTNGTVTVTPTGTLLITLPATGDSAFLIKHLPAPTSKMTIAFRIKYTSAAPGIAEVDLVQLHWDMPTAGCASEGFYLVRNSTGPFDLQETYTGGCGTNVNTELVDLANSGFHDVKMTLSLGVQSVAHIQVLIDALPPYEVTAAHPIPSSTVRLEIGGGAVRDVTTTFTVEYDDLVIEVQ